MTEKVTENGSESKQRIAKVITITNAGARWVVNFEGVVTKRDIHRINRILTVEFTRAQRRYSLNRKKELKNVSKETVTHAGS